MTDDKVAVMLLKLGAAQGLGIYVMLLLHLRTKIRYEASCQPDALLAVAARSGMDVDLIRQVIFDFGLFETDGERQMFRSHYLDEVMRELESRWKTNAENGQKGGRPRKAEKCAETPMDKGRKPNETQEKRGEEKKGISTVVTNSSNTGAEKAAVAVVGDKAAVGDKASVPADAAEGGMKVVPADTVGQRPLQRVVPWERLVDELAASRSYMELAGQHSGLGLLFLEHQPQVIRLFKEHIRLYGKGGGLLFLEDVRRYFSNYVAAGSTSCHKLQEKLLEEVRENEHRKENRFETVVDGKRMYLGHLIPFEASPRPDASAVWDGVRHRWVH